MSRELVSMTQAHEKFVPLVLSFLSGFLLRCCKLCWEAQFDAILPSNKRRRVLIRSQKWCVVDMSRV